MIHKINEVISAMIEHEHGVAHRVHHFLKVYSFAKAIGENEGMDDDALELLEVAAVTHDIGIRISLEKYHSSAGSYQQLEGPALVKDLLAGLGGYSPEFIDRVCYLNAHHHTYHDISGLDYQILVEADFLVNLYEDHASHEQIVRVRDKIFKTKTGISYLNKIFLE